MEQLVQPFTITIKHRGKEVSINIPATEKGIHIAIEDQGIEISTTPQEEPLQEATETVVPLTRQGIINRLKENPILMSMYEAFGIPDTPKNTNFHFFYYCSIFILYIIIKYYFNLKNISYLYIILEIYSYTLYKWNNSYNPLLSLSNIEARRYLLTYLLPKRAST